MRETAPPLVTYIVLSYNHERYIGQTIKSIIEQTIQDIEIVIIDDASSDRSVDVIRSFGDPRIKLCVNEQNTRGAGAKTRAVNIARGTYLANLDSDDWIASQKTERQLSLFRQNPNILLAGTYAHAVDVAGNRHPRAEVFERLPNVPYDLNLLDSWVVQNPVVQSSTMLHRSVYNKIGDIDMTMEYAGDYEFWTRAFRYGCPWGLVREPLTFYRFYESTSLRNPQRTFLEIAYLLKKNLIPVVEDRNAFGLLRTIFDWLSGHRQLQQLAPPARYRLIGLFFTSSQFRNYAEFSSAIFDADEGELPLFLGKLLLEGSHNRSAWMFVKKQLIRKLLPEGSFNRSAWTFVKKAVESRTYFRKRGRNL